MLTKHECFCGLDLFEFSFWDGFEFSLFLPFGTDCTCHIEDESVVPCETGRSLFDLVRIQRERCLRNKHLFHLPSPSPPPPRGMDSRDIVSSSFLVLATSQVFFLPFFYRRYMAETLSLWRKTPNRQSIFSILCNLFIQYSVQVKGNYTVHATSILRKTC